jgi:multidrug resistance efflux pump
MNPTTTQVAISLMLLAAQEVQKYAALVQKGNPTQAELDALTAEAAASRAELQAAIDAKTLAEQASRV